MNGSPSVSFFKFLTAERRETEPARPAKSSFTSLVAKKWFSADVTPAGPRTNSLYVFFFFPVGTLSMIHPRPVALFTENEYEN